MLILYHYVDYSKTRIAVAFLCLKNKCPPVFVIAKYLDYMKNSTGSHFSHLNSKFRLKPFHFFFQKGNHINETEQRVTKIKKLYIYASPLIWYNNEQLRGVPKMWNDT